MKILFQVQGCELFNFLKLFYNLLILGNRFLFNIIILLNFRKSTQRRKILFFLNIYNIIEVANNFDFRIIFF